MKVTILLAMMATYAAGVPVVCRLNSNIQVHMGQKICEIEQPTFAPYTVIEDCGVACKCSGSDVECCVGVNCVTVNEACKKITIDAGSPSCSADRKRRDVIDLLLRTKRSGKYFAMDYGGLAPTTTTTAVGPPPPTMRK